MKLKPPFKDPLKQIRREIKSGNYDRADAVVEWLIENGTISIFKELIGKTFINRAGELYVNPDFVVHANKQQVVDYAFFQILAIAPKKALDFCQFDRAAIRKIVFRMHGNINLVQNDRKQLWPSWMKNCKLKKFPSLIWKFRNLEEIDGRDTEFSEIPASIGKCKNLRSLKINNGLITTLPDSFGELSRLTELNLGKNKIRFFPESFGRLKQLSILRLYINELHEIPAFFGNLKKLRFLDVRRNRISRVNPGLYRAKSLYNLQLCKNQLSELPNGISKLRRLECFTVSDNPKFSKLPADFKKLDQLNSLDMRFCRSLFPPGIRRIFHERERVEYAFIKLNSKFKPSTDDDEIMEWDPNDPWFDIPEKVVVAADESIPEAYRTEFNLISPLFKSFKPHLFTAGLRLLQASNNPILSDLCLSVIDKENLVRHNDRSEPLQEWQDCILALVEHLNHPDFPLWKGSGSWLDSLEGITLPVQKPDIVNTLGIFTRLERVNLSFLFSPESFHFTYLDDIKVLRVSVKNSGTFSFEGEDLYVRRIEITSSELTKKLEITGLPELEEINIYQTCKFPKLVIRDCPSLRTIKISVERYERINVDWYTSVSISNCQMLRVIEIGEWKISDLRITDCPMLEKLSISTLLNDPQNVKFHNLPSLRELSLCQCGLTALPEFIKNAGSTQFKSLDLTDNFIKELPQWIGEFNTLERLVLCKNRFKSVPSVIQNFRRLTELHLGGQGDTPTLENFPDGGFEVLESLGELQRLSATLSDSNFRKIAHHVKSSGAVLSLYVVESPELWS